MRPLRKAVTMFAARYVMRAIYQCGGNVTAAARQLGITRSHVYVVLRRNGIARVASSTYQKPGRPLHTFTTSPRQDEASH